MIQRERLAYEKGYRVENGVVHGLSGNIRKLGTDKYGYLRFSFAIGSRTDNTKKTHNVFVHRLVAYQKYKDNLYKPGIEVRHLNGNKIDNTDSNIAIGTRSQNRMDMPKEIRIRVASKANLRYDHKAVKEYYLNCRSYKQTMTKFKIKSSCTLHNIIHKP